MSARWFGKSRSITLQPSDLNLSSPTFRGMAVRRLVAAADMAAGPAQAQMQPRRPDFQALLAAESAGRYIADGVSMAAFVGHQSLPVGMESAGLSPISAR